MNLNNVGIILAAGKGSRMKSFIPKPFQRLGGEYLLNHVINSFKKSGIEKIFIVISPEISSMAEISNYGKKIQFTIQKNPNGTGDALLNAIRKIKDDCTLVVAPCDVPLVDSNTIKLMLQRMEELHTNSNVLVGKIEDPFGYGRVLVDKSKKKIQSIVEQNNLNVSQQSIDIINTSWYCFKKDWIKNKLSKIKISNNGELLLTDVFNESLNERETSYTMVKDKKQSIGINSKSDLAKAEKAFRDSIIQEHMISGVTVIDPGNTYVDSQVIIESDSVIHPGTHIRGNSIIRTKSEIGPNTIIENSEIDYGAKVVSSHISNSFIGKNSIIGSNSRIRNDSKIEDNCVIGNGAEIKNSKIGINSRVSHFSYIGDSKLGKNVNIGAGTVTCNYDGKLKHSTFIGDNVFIGSGTMLIAPVKIFSNSRTGAGSVVKNNVKSGETVVGSPAKPISKGNKKNQDNSNV